MPISFHPNAYSLSHGRRLASQEELNPAGIRGEGVSPGCERLQPISDSETVLYDRIRRVISEPRQVIWWYDEDAWSKALNYSERPLEIARGIYESVRAAMIFYARVHYTQDGHLGFVHSLIGVWTLKGEFDKTASHNEHHLSQTRRALSARP